MKLKMNEDRTKFLIILILNVISVILIYYFKVKLKTSILIAHFFYFPSILACLWWKWKGVIIPVFLTVILILFNLVPETNFLNLEIII